MDHPDHGSRKPLNWKAPELAQSMRKSMPHSEQREIHYRMGTPPTIRGSFHGRPSNLQPPMPPELTKPLIMKSHTPDNLVEEIHKALNAPGQQAQQQPPQLARPKVPGVPQHETGQEQSQTANDPPMGVAPSGTEVYADPFHPAHQDFGAPEHQAAAQLQQQGGNGQAASAHEQMGMDLLSPMDRAQERFNSAQPQQPGMPAAVMNNETQMPGMPPPPAENPDQGKPIAPPQMGFEQRQGPSPGMEQAQQPPDPGGMPGAQAPMPAQDPMGAQPPPMPGAQDPGMPGAQPPMPPPDPGMMPGAQAPMPPDPSMMAPPPMPMDPSMMAPPPVPMDPSMMQPGMDPNMMQPGMAPPMPGMPPGMPGMSPPMPGAPPPMPGAPQPGMPAPPGMGPMMAPNTHPAGHGGGEPSPIQPGAGSPPTHAGSQDTPIEPSAGPAGGQSQPDPFDMNSEEFAPEGEAGDEQPVGGPSGGGEAPPTEGGGDGSAGGEAPPAEGGDQEQNGGPPWAKKSVAGANMSIFEQMGMQTLNKSGVGGPIAKPSTMSGIDAVMSQISKPKKAGKVGVSSRRMPSQGRTDLATANPPKGNTGAQPRAFAGQNTSSIDKLAGQVSKPKKAGKVGAMGERGPRGSRARLGASKPPIRKSNTVLDTIGLT